MGSLALAATDDWPIGSNDCMIGASHSVSHRPWLRGRSVCFQVEHARGMLQPCARFLVRCWLAFSTCADLWSVCLGIFQQCVFGKAWSCSQRHCRPVSSDCAASPTFEGHAVIGCESPCVCGGMESRVRGQ